MSMLRMASILTEQDPSYRDLMITFLEHGVRIAGAINQQGLWDEADAFYYDALHLPDGTSMPLRIHSMIGLLPVLPATSVPRGAAQLGAAFGKHFARFLANAGVTDAVDRARGSITRDARTGIASCSACCRPSRSSACSREVLDEEAFLSPHGLRALSRRHRDQPFSVTVGGVTATVDYEPGESTTGLFGGNSNWRGPVWFPVNYLFIESLLRWDDGLGETFTVEYPTGSGQRLRLRDVARDLAMRLVGDLAARCRGSTARVRRDTIATRRIPSGGTCSSSTSTSTGTPAPGSAPRIRPAGPAWSPTSCAAAGSLDSAKSGLPQDGIESPSEQPQGEAMEGMAHGR